MSELSDFKKQFNPEPDDFGNEDKKSFLKRFAEYLSSFLGRKATTGDNSLYISEADSDEEKEAIEASCNDIDNYYAEMEKLRKLDDDYNANKYIVENLQELNKEDGIEEDDDAISEKLSKYWDKKATRNASTIFDTATDPQDETDDEKL